jgi:hypothetical protein
LSHQRNGEHRAEAGQFEPESRRRKSQRSVMRGLQIPSIRSGETTFPMKGPVSRELPIWTQRPARRLSGRMIASSSQVLPASRRHGYRPTASSSFFSRNHPAGLRVSASTDPVESQMDPQTKHEIKVLALSTLAAIPVAASIGFVVVSGLVAW